MIFFFISAPLSGPGGMGMRGGMGGMRGRGGFMGPPGGPGNDIYDFSCCILEITLTVISIYVLKNSAHAADGNDACCNNRVTAKS